MLYHDKLVIVTFILWIELSLTSQPLFIRATGCDYGECSVPNTDYSIECLLGYQHLNDIYDICCHHRRMLFENQIDLLQTDSTPSPTCQTIDYAYNCIVNYDNTYFNTSDDGICTNVHNGIGVINIGNGVFNMSESIILNDDEQISIQGQGILNTTLNYIGNETTWFDFDGSNCYLKMSNLSVSSDSNLLMQQLFATNGAIIEFDNVLFEPNLEGIWEFTSSSKAIFRNCVFRNNNAKYIFNGAHGTFINCIFSNNKLKAGFDLDEDVDEGLFVIENSYLTLLNCLFHNINTMNVPLFTVDSGTLIINANHFVNITGNNSEHYQNCVFYIGATLFDEITVRIIDSLFYNISNYEAIIWESQLSILVLTSIIIQGSIFKECVNMYDYYGAYIAYGSASLTVSNTQFLNGKAFASLYVLHTNTIKIENTVWDNYDVDWVILKETLFYIDASADSYFMLDNITIRNINGGGVNIRVATTPINIIDSVFQNITVLHKHNYTFSCLALYVKQKYILRNNIFKNCHGDFSAVLILSPDDQSILQSLTFINNSAAESLPADLVMYNNGSDITINGAWYISGSHVNHHNTLSSAIWFRDTSNSTFWTLDMDAWIVKNTLGFPAIWFHDMNFNFDNLTAINNEKGVIIVSHESLKRVAIYSISNSYFKGNNDTIIQHADDQEWLVSTLWLKNNTFIENVAILTIVRNTGLINLQIASKKFCVYGSNDYILTNISCKYVANSIQISVLSISNLTSGIHGSWYGCNNGKCHLENFQFVDLNVNQIKITTDNEFEVQTGGIQPQVHYVESNIIWFIFQNYIANATTQFVFDNVNVMLMNCTFENGMSHADIEYGMLQITNNALLTIETCTFTNNQKVLINASNSAVHIQDTNFMFNLGRNDLLSHPMISTQLTVINIFNSLFKQNSHFSAIIDMNYSGFPCYYSMCHTIIANSTFINGYNNYCDYCSTNGVDLLITNCVFSNGTSYTNSLNILDDSNIVITNTIWNYYLTDNIVKQQSQNNTHMIFSNNTISNLNGRGVYIDGEYSSIHFSASRFYKIANNGNGACILLHTKGQCTINNTIFDQCKSMSHGGAIMAKQATHFTVDSSSFYKCSAQFAGAISINPNSNTSKDLIINIQNSIFEENDAIIGSAIYFYMENQEPIIISERHSIIVSPNNPTKHIQLNSVFLENESFVPSHIFVALIPNGYSTINYLKWSSLYQWNNQDIHFSISDNSSLHSFVDNSLYKSSLFIPMSLSNGIWAISNYSQFNLELNFQNFIFALSNATALSFEIILIAQNSFDISQRNVNSESILLTLEDLIFSQNHADVLSTVLYALIDDVQPINIYINNSTFNENIASCLSSFAIINSNTNNNSNKNIIIKVEFTKFINNIAHTSGAALAIFGIYSSLSCNKCVFTHNMVRELGAAIFMKYGELMLVNSQITHNESPLGGNVLLDHCKLYAYDSFFTHNKAYYGGGSAIQIDNIYQNQINYTDLVTVVNCSFIGNIGTHSGSFYVSTKPSIDSSDISGRKLLSIIHTNTTISNKKNNSCLGIEIIIDFDFHLEDISWSIQLDNKSTNIISGSISPYTCIENVPSSVECLVFTIFDDFGDGLNYGQGSYRINWQHQHWSSISGGNFGHYESLTICPTQQNNTNFKILKVLSTLGSKESLLFVEFVQNQILSAMDNALQMLLVFKTNRGLITGNNQICNCGYGYCYCISRTHNVMITMEDLVSMLCYSWVPEVRGIHNYTYADFWFGNTVAYEETILTTYCSFGTNDAYDFLLESNYEYFEQDHWINSSSYRDKISQIMQHTSTYCDLYSIMYDVIDPICKDLIANFSINPVLCQSTHCYSSYCSSNDTYLSVRIDNREYELWDHIHYAGSTLLNIPYLPSFIYNCDEEINMTQINNTIPIIFEQNNNCNIVSLIKEFNKHGARAVLIAINTIENININKSIPNVYIPVELINVKHVIKLMNEKTKQTLRIGILCVTLEPTSAPTTSPTANPTGNPTPYPTQLPTTYPTIVPTPNPTNKIQNDDEFIVFTYQDDDSTFQMAVSFPHLRFSQFLDVYQDRCMLMINENIDFVDDEYIYFITVDTVFQEFNNICVQLNDDTNRVVSNWTLIDHNDGIYLTSTSINVVNKACNSNIIEYRTFLPRINRGTYCFVLWTNVYHDKTKYNIIIKPLFRWPTPSISIHNCQFINNTNTKRKGGAIAITSNNYKYVSVSINNTIFRSNNAGLGGNDIYTQFTQTISEYDKEYTFMSMLEMNNIVIHNSVHDSGAAIMTELITSQKDGFIFRNGISLENLTIINSYDHDHVSTGNMSSISLNGANTYIKDSFILNGTAFNGGCIWINNTALTLYNTTIQNCVAHNNGGGLYSSSVDRQYSSYDLCVSMYYTQFINNYAARDGAAIFIQLQGKQQNDLKSKESCIKTYNITFNDNQSANDDDDSIYLFIPYGYHHVLDNNTPLTRICTDSECLVGSNTLKYFCASVNASKCSNYVDKPSLLEYISSDTATMYLFGWNAFLNPLNTKYYSIEPFSNKAIIFKPNDENGKYYNVPLKIYKGETNATVLLKDKNKVASSIMLQLIKQSKRITQTKETLAIQMIILIVSLTMSVVVSIICVIISCTQYRKYKNAYVVQNGLVLIIGITKFDKNTYDLPRDINNIAKLVKLWQNMYNYEVRVCNYSKNVIYYCTKQDVINFIDEQVEELRDYDSVIVHILTHGQNGDQFQTSDGKTLKLDFIKHELSEASDNKCLKIVFYHACRGDVNYHTGETIDELNETYDENNCDCNLCCISKDFRQNDKIQIPQQDLDHIQSVQMTNIKVKISNKVAKSPVAHRAIVSFNNNNDSYNISSDANFITLFGNIKNRTTSSKGYFTHCVCEVFGENAKKWKKKGFVELIIGSNGLCRKLAQMSQHAAICSTEGIGTMQFGKSVRFDVCKKTRQHKIEDMKILYRTNTMDEVLPLMSKNVNNPQYH
eukprot:354356_1